MQKLYCYVDESGQDTLGELFIVSVVVSKEQRHEMREHLLQIEAASRKGATKWMKTSRDRKAAYFHNVFADSIFVGALFFSRSHGTRDYRPLTILTVASAVTAASHGAQYKAVVVIDGLKDSEQQLVGTGLRRIGISTQKIRGSIDESDPLIRLADAVAGLIRDAERGNEDSGTLLRAATRRGLLIDVGME